MVMRNVLLLFCLMVAIAASAQVNWEDSVKVYRDQARNGDVDAYEKLARCYLEGKGVDHNIVMTLWMMIQAYNDSNSVDKHTILLFQNLPEGHVDKIKMEAILAYTQGDFVKLREINKRLITVDPGSGELVEGVLYQMNDNNEEAARHFTKAEELGCAFAGVFKWTVQKPNLEEEYINTLLNIAPKYPIVYNSLGDFMVQTIDKDKDREAQAVEYYKMADEYASLSKYGKAFLEYLSKWNEKHSVTTREEDYEEVIPDSIPIESVNDDFDLEIKEVELTDRYGVVVQGGKYGIRDFEKQENVTEIMYDKAYPSYRKKVMDEYITYFYIRMGNQSGVVGITESSNQTMTIMAPPKSEE